MAEKSWHEMRYLIEDFMQQQRAQNTITMAKLEEMRIEITVMKTKAVFYGAAAAIMVTWIGQYVIKKL